MVLDWGQQTQSVACETCTFLLCSRSAPVEEQRAPAGNIQPHEHHSCLQHSERQNLGARATTDLCSVSARLIAVPNTLTSSSLAFGVGFGASPYSMFSAPPGFFRTMAFMIPCCCDGVADISMEDAGVGGVA